VKVLRGAWRFFAGDAPEMVPVVALVVGLALARGHPGYAVALLPIVVVVSLTASVTTRARRRRRAVATRGRGGGAPSVEGQLAVGAAQAEGFDQ
jgi:hypothetical protein